MAVAFDPDDLLTIVEYEALDDYQRNDYDRAHLLHDIGRVRGSGYLREKELDNAPFRTLLIEWSNAIELGAPSPAIAHTYLIGRYIAVEYDRNPQKYGGPPPVLA